MNHDTNGNEQPQQPQPDDMVLLNAEQTLAMLVHKMLLQQALIDSHEHRLEMLEGLLRGDRVQ